MKDAPLKKKSCVAGQVFTLKIMKRKLRERGGGRMFKTNTKGVKYFLNNLSEFWVCLLCAFWHIVLFTGYGRFESMGFLFNL